jgi:hypothetical protein
MGKSPRSLINTDIIIGHGEKSMKMRKEKEANILAIKLKGGKEGDHALGRFFLLSTMDQVLVKDDLMETIEPRITTGRGGGVLRGTIEEPRGEGDRMTPETATVVIQEETLRSAWYVSEE